MSGKYIGIDLGSEFLKIAVHENNRICGKISERIPEQIRMDGKILSLESAAEFLKKKQEENMDYPDTAHAWFCQKNR